jgi:hypothetical protein
VVESDDGEEIGQQKMRWRGCVGVGDGGAVIDDGWMDDGWITEVGAEAVWSRR